jgi:hypothetical protein
MPLGPRAVVRFEFREKRRTGVVIFGPLANGNVVLIFGTRTERELERVKVRPQEPGGVALQLYADTFFPGNTLVLPVTELALLDKRCPPELFLQLSSLARKALASRH